MQIIKESFVGQRGLFHADVAGVPVLSYIPSVDVCEECQKMLSGTILWFSLIISQNPREKIQA